MVGFDDIPLARYTPPALTTASVPVTVLGAHAWRRMWDLLNGRCAGSGNPAAATISRAEASTGPARLGGVPLADRATPTNTQADRPNPIARL